MKKEIESPLTIQQGDPVSLAGDGRNQVTISRGSHGIKDYTHSAPDNEIHAISGYYFIEKEDLLDYEGMKVLYAIGNGVIDSSCCGQGGCRYAIVPGYLIRWKNRRDEQGRPISEVASIVDQTARAEIRRLLERQEFVTQVQFW